VTPPTPGPRPARRAQVLHRALSEYAATWRAWRRGTCRPAGWSRRSPRFDPGVSRSASHLELANSPGRAGPAARPRTLLLPAAWRCACSRCRPVAQPYDVHAGLGPTLGRCAAVSTRVIHWLGRRWGRPGKPCADVAAPGDHLYSASPSPGQRPGATGGPGTPPAA